jgi:hypothetical protein
MDALLVLSLWRRDCQYEYVAGFQREAGQPQPGRLGARAMTPPGGAALGHRNIESTMRYVAGDAETERAAAKVGVVLQGRRPAAAALGARERLPAGVGSLARQGARVLDERRRRRPDAAAPSARRS